MSQGIRSWIRGLLKVPRETVGRTLSKVPRETAGGTESKTRSKNQKRVLKCWNETTKLRRVAWRTATEHFPGLPCLTVSEGAAGHCWQDTVQGSHAWKLERKIEIQLQTTRLDHHNLQVTDYGHVEKVFTNRRRKLNRTEDDEMFDLDTNVLIWRRFMSTTKSAIHLGLNYDRYVIACQNQNFGGTKTLFDISLRLNFTKNSVDILSLSTTM